MTKDPHLQAFVQRLDNLVVRAKAASLQGDSTSLIQTGKELKNYEKLWMQMADGGAVLQSQESLNTHGQGSRKVIQRMTPLGEIPNAQRSIQALKEIERAREKIVGNIHIHFKTKKSDTIGLANRLKETQNDLETAISSHDIDQIIHLLRAQEQFIFDTRKKVSELIFESGQGDDPEQRFLVLSRREILLTEMNMAKADFRRKQKLVRNAKINNTEVHRLCTEDI